MQELIETKRRTRPVYEFSILDMDANGNISPMVADDYVTKSFGLVKLDMDEEVTAAERAGKNAAKLAYNLARASLVEVDGRPLNKGEAEDEKVLRHCDPALRELILNMYAEISSAPDGASKKLKAGMKVKLP